MSVSITIEGDKELASKFDNLSKAASKKVVLVAFRKTSAIFTRALRSAMPAGLKKSVGTKALKGEDATLVAGVMSNKKYKSGKGSELDAWTVAYWLEFGTMANRSTGHTFVRPRRRKSANWKGGIVGKGTVNSAWEQTQGTIEKETGAILQTEIEKAIK